MPRRPSSQAATQSATETTYDNTTSGLESTNVQGAIDEIVETDISAGLVVPLAQADVTYNATFEYITAALYHPYKPFVDFGVGTHTPTLPGGKATEITLRGDLRGHVGLSYSHGQTIFSIGSGVGSGVASLSSGGTDILTITANVTNPALTEVVVGDKVITNDSSGNVLQHTIVEIISSNAFRLNPSAPATMNTNNGCSVTFLPNRIISNQLILTQGTSLTPFKFIGFWFTGGFILYNHSHVKLQNCCVDNVATASEPTAGIVAYDNSIVEFLADENSVTRCYTGIQAWANSQILGGVSLVRNANYGVRLYGARATLNKLVSSRNRNIVKGGMLDIKNSYFAGNMGGATLLEYTGSSSGFVQNCSFNNSYYGLTATYDSTVYNIAGNTFSACNYNTATHYGTIVTGY